MNRACFRSGGGYGDTGYTWQHEGGCDGSLLVVLTFDSPNTAICNYAKWQIETLFGVFQRRGFCLESTHLAEAKRLSKLIALLALALCWASRTGEWLHQLKPITIKKHGRSRQKSVPN